MHNFFGSTKWLINSLPLPHIHSLSNLRLDSAKDEPSLPSCNKLISSRRKENFCCFRIFISHYRSCCSGGSARKKGKKSMKKSHKISSIILNDVMNLASCFPLIPDCLRMLDGYWNSTVLSREYAFSICFKRPNQEAQRQLTPKGFIEKIKLSSTPFTAPQSSPTVPWVSIKCLCSSDFCFVSCSKETTKELRFVLKSLSAFRSRKKTSKRERKSYPHQAVAAVDEKA